MIELIKEILFGISDPNVHQAVLPALMVLGGLGQAAAGYDWGGKRRKALDSAREAYDNQKAIYKGLDTSNAYANLQNRYKGMENTMEDLVINQQQARFEKQMFQQQQASIMSGLRGAAGGSGVAGLAQAMANQAQTQSQRAAASIGQQEARNNLLAAQQAAKIGELKAANASTIDQLKAKGELTSMQMEQSKQATLLGMNAQAVTGAQQAQMQGQQMMAQGLTTAIGGLGDLDLKTGEQR